jgi:hypothetical protein
VSSRNPWSHSSYACRATPSQDVDVSAAKGSTDGPRGNHFGDAWDGDAWARRHLGWRHLGWRRLGWRRGGAIRRRGARN